MDQNNELIKSRCEPCHSGSPTLNANEIEALLAQLHSGWRLVDNHHLEKKYQFPNFLTGLAFINALGRLAEQEGHHPNIYLTYHFVTVTIWTHKIDSLSKNDFILAAKCDELIKQLHKGMG